MYRASIRPLLLTAACLAICGPAHASEASAKRLQTLFTGLIADNAASLKGSGDALETTGEVKVTESAGTYNITLPKMSVRHTDLSRLEIGTTAITAQDSGKDGEWNASVKFPASTSFIDPTGKTAITATVGAQDFKGTLNEKLRAFTTVDSHLRNITVTDNARKTKTVIDALDLMVDLKEKSPGVRSGPVRLEVSHVNLTAADGGNETIGKITIDANILGVGQDGAVAAVPAKPGIMDLFSLYFGAGKSGFDTNITANDIVITTPGKSVLNVGETNAHFSVTNFKDQNADFLLGLGFNGLRSTPPQPGVGGLLPDHFRLDFTVGSLPYSQIFEITKQIGPAGLGSPLGALILAGQLPTLLNNAGSEVRVKDSGFGNDKYEMKLDGAFRADSTSPIFTTGKAHGEVTGFPFIIDTLTTATNNPKLDPLTKERAQSLLSGLTVMQMIGQQKGEATRVYDIELTKDGKAMLNGTDMSTLIGAVQHPPVTKPQ